MRPDHEVRLVLAWLLAAAAVLLALHLVRR